ncbi:hypothetical protein V6R21_14870 [Limibacter armeniacum]|uniref:hypothetical protein n=1 Tax=Limibacter armeniacum TaxID=466084 RepID=UPI002FE535A8
MKTLIPQVYLTITLLYISISVTLVACNYKIDITQQVGNIASENIYISYFDIEQSDNLVEIQASLFKINHDSTSLRIIIPYDFEQKKISSIQDSNKGIPVLFDAGFNNKGCRADVVIEVGDLQEYKIKGELLSKEKLNDWVRKNILNYGKDPRLSESPHDAVFSLVFTPNQPLNNANMLIYQLVQAYEEFLFERADIEKTTIEQAKEKYPLNIRLTTDSNL